MGNEIKCRELSMAEYKDEFGRPAMGRLAESVGSSLKYFDSVVVGSANGGRDLGVLKGKDGKSMVDRVVEKMPELFSKKSLRPDVF